jgi:4-amino-4-deoxy-L-arabinose transferase-like glycosyltransferase
MPERVSRNLGQDDSGSVAGRAARGFIPFLVPAVLLLVLLALVDRDPATGVTASRSPFSDEAWSVMNARNLVRLGTWAPDDWHLYLVNLPFSVLEAIAFQVAGVGIVQARLLSVVATVATATMLLIGLRGPFGRMPAAVAAISFASSTLVLYYGRLALLEPMVAASITLAVILVARAGDERSGRFGFVAGLALATAIGTKPNAGFAVIGILVGVAVVGAHTDPAVRRWLAAAIAVIAAAGVAWLGLVGLPHAAEVAADVRIWPPQRIPRSIGDLVSAVAHYPFSSDGAVLAAAPVGLAGIAGVAATIAHWHDMDATGRRLVSAAVGWLVMGSAPLLILSYHPNRYAMPLIPALSILVAAGLSALRPTLARLNVGVRRVSAVTLAVVLAIPGATAYAGWISHGSRDLVTVQSDVERLVPAGSVVEGDFAPLFAMTTRARTIVSWPSAGVNAGDAYATQGVRWLMVAPDAPPSWVALHAAAWSGRRRVMCLTWGADDVCLFALP